MLYKTMVLALLEERPALYEKLRQHRMLLPALEEYARDLKTRHEACKEMLAWARPGSESSQIASEALEIALQELQDCLDSASPPDESDPILLDGAMAFIRRHTPPG